MENSKTDRQLYYKLTNHNLGQYLIFMLIFSVILFFAFHGILQVMEETVIEKYLEGKVYNTGQLVSMQKESRSAEKATSYYSSWAIDIYIGTSQESRYWLNPTLSLILPISLLSVWLTLIISSFMPISLGLIRHKIEREIIHVLDNIHYKIHGFYSTDENRELMNEIKTADTRAAHDFAERWNLLHEDISSLQKVLFWLHGSVSYKIFHPWSGLKFYLRFYFTEKYSNIILGLVYIGAAVLIIIIGMRGLKFIPSTQPSLVFFALGLEFSVLLTYAFSVMYSRNENESEQDKNKENQYAGNYILSDEFGNSKEVENLLRAFIRSPKPERISEKRE
ncbi:MAG: hypothetical protein M9949_05735 [Candidatus Kapabacteria bacterium]|nr:hypothetical protein [Candidatus Kapabacteria bacterium]